jgi:flagellar hook-associated protein 2
MDLSSIMRASTVRFSGLSSGIDTEQLVQDLMRAHRAPLDKLYQKKQLLEWQQEDFRNINKELLAFREKIFDMTLSSAYLVYRVNSTNASVATATAGSNSMNSSVSLVVTQLAQAATASSTAGISGGSKIDPTMSLDSQRALFGTDWTSNSFDITVYHQDGTSTTKTINFDPAVDSLDAVLKKISADPDLKVTAFYDAATDKVVITSRETGDNNESGNDIVFSGDFLTGTLKLDNSADINGKDAILSINGHETSKKSNQFTLNGVTYSLAGTGSTMITVQYDVDAVYEKIKDLVDQYNSLINNIYAKLTEKRYRDYPPLTQEQKDQMKENEIKLWEEKARSGLLAGNPELTRGLLQLERNWMDFVKGVPAGHYDQISDIGISTISYQTRGELKIDETKLKEALSQNPEQVIALFTRSAEPSETPESEYTGIATRMYQTLKQMIDMITEKAGSTTSFTTVDNSELGKLISDNNEQINLLNARLIKLENRYWAQFTAMEKAIAEMNAQATWLAQQFSG